jgi:uncharacterized protein YkwD
VALVLLMFVSLLWSGIATDHARAGAKQQRRSEVLQLTNEDRAAKDREALKLDRKLSRYAVGHAREMAEAGSLFHSEDLAGVLDGVEWSMAGENVGVGSSLSDLQAAFMASKPHRKNVLNRGFDHVAIGVVKSDGNFWVTVIFYG